MQPRHRIIMLLHKAGRHDLAAMAWRLIPIDRTGARRMSLRELILAERRGLY